MQIINKFKQLKTVKTNHKIKMKVKMKKFIFIIQRSKTVNKSQGITTWTINIIWIIKVIKFSMDRIMKDSKILKH